MASFMGAAFALSVRRGCRWFAKGVPLPLVMLSFSAITSAHDVQAKDGKDRAIVPGTHRLPVFFVNHGGGPMPVLGDPDHEELVGQLRGFEALLGDRLKEVKSVLVISAHHETHLPTVTSAEKPSLVYDYYGFPPESYKITYPAPGSPALASRVQYLLEKAGIMCHLDARRGFDHGLFIPLKIMMPEAKVPCCQLSLKSGLDPSSHLAMGAAIQALRDEGVLIIGSGMTYHNMRGLLSGEVDMHRTRQFLNWLVKTCGSDEAKRTHEFLAWETAPSARYNHPREEHLIPLLVCAGAAGTDVGRSVFAANILGVPTTGFQFGN
eukprot:EG_transcript_9435